jgi:hypothetical protein
VALILRISELLDFKGLYPHPWFGLVQDIDGDFWIGRALFDDSLGGETAARQVK